MSFDLDLFVIHADSDRSFVSGYLLPRLGLDEARVRISSQLRLGAFRAEELARDIERSRVIVPVLSPAYRAEQWALFGEQLATFVSIGGHRLIPLLLEECDLPPAIRALVGLDLRDASTWDGGVGQLRAVFETDPLSDEPPIPCPYPGMRPFTHSDSPHFHGREREIGDVIGRLHAGEREIYVIGPSGSGKSSLVTAGVLPRLPSDVIVRSLRPGQRPRTRLLDALGGNPRALLVRNPGASSVLVFVDQLEELFTQADGDEARGFVEALGDLRAEERIVLILAIRADFYGAFMASDLWPDLDRQLCRVDVAPLRNEALRAAIELPARDVGVYFETRLVDRLLADAAAEPGALPLLQDVLFRLWESRKQRYVPLAAYDALGVEGRSGLAVTLGRRADAALHSLSSHQQRIARRIFLRLVSFGEGRPDTRRSRTRADLGADSRAASHIAVTLDRFVERRLLISDGRGPASEVWYDIAHEALISAWPQLREWIETGRTDEQRRQSLEEKAKEWVRGRCGTLDEIEFKEVEKWLERQPERAHSRTVEDLVAASRAAVQALHAERAKIEEQRNEYRRIVALKFQDQGRQLLLDGRPLRALPCFVAARQLGLESAPLRILFARALRNRVKASVHHGGPVATVQFSPDGTRIITAGGDGTARVWDACSGRPISPPLLHRGFVAAAAFSPDGKRVATASHDQSARIWDARSGREVGAPIAHQGGLTAVAWDLDGARILTASYDGSARVWDVASGNPVTPPLRHRDLVVAAVFAPVGARIATASHDHSARVWDARTGKAITPPLEHRDLVRTVAFSADGQRVITASDDRTARVWSALSGELVATFAEHRLALRAAAFSPDGLRAVTASEDKTARVWDASTGQELCVVEHQSTVRAALFSSDGTRLLTASDDETARLWDASSGRPLGPPLEHEGSVRSAAFSPDGGRIVTACHDGMARLWHATSAEMTGRTLQHEGFVRAATFCPDGARIVTASDDGTACVWDSQSGKRLRRLSVHDKAVLSCCVSGDGAALVTASADCTARIWRAASGKAIKHSIEHRGTVRSAVFSPDGTRIATASADRTARIWDASSGRALAGPFVHQKAVVAAAFNHDGTLLVTASDDGTARVWDTSSGRPVSPPLTHGDAVRSASFSPDGRLVVTASADRTAGVWDPLSGARRARLEHKEALRGAAFSPDGSRIVTAGEDKTARIWDARSGKPLTPPLEHQAAVMAAAFSPDGTLVVTASADRTARVWDAASGQPLLPPLEHGEHVVMAAFSPDGAHVVTASLDRTARIWMLPAHAGTLEQWSALADQHSPFQLRDGILVPRR